MDYEKIFWGFTAVVFIGFFAFLAMGIAARPGSSNAGAQAAAAQQNSGAGTNADYAQYGQGAQTAGAGASQAAGTPAQEGVQAAGIGAAQQAQAAPSQGGQLAAVNNGVQEVQLSVQGGNYMPNPIRVKVGVPVRLVADIANMPGCSKSVVMRDFGVSKTVQAGDNVIEFTPTQSGTFSFSCSMGMYRGTVIVEGADGTVANYAGAAAPAATGGCGCGGRI